MKTKGLIKDFSGQYWKLLMAIALLPIIAIISYLLIFTIDGKENDFWLTIISCIIPYLGTMGWGIFIFYHTWRHDKEEELRSIPKISISYDYDEVSPIHFDEPHSCLYSHTRLIAKKHGNLSMIRTFNRKHLDEDDCGYLGLSIINLSSRLVYFGCITDVYVVNRDLIGSSNIKVEKQSEHIIFFSKESHFTLTYKDRLMLYVGVDKDLADTRSKISRDIYVLFSIEDEHSREYIYISFIYYTSGTILMGRNRIVNKNELKILSEKPSVFFENNRYL